MAFTGVMGFNRGTIILIRVFSKVHSLHTMGRPRIAGSRQDGGLVRLAGAARAAVSAALSAARRITGRASRTAGLHADGLFQHFHEASPPVGNAASLTPAKSRGRDSRCHAGVAE